MRLPPAAGTVLMRDRAHWTRCSFALTALVDDIVTLAPLEAIDATLDDAHPFAGGFAGLAFDRHCRFFHPLPEDGAIEYLLWGKQTALRVEADVPHRFEMTGAESESGSFGAGAPLPTRPLALACDEADYLYVADPGNGTDAPSLWLVDTWQGEIARRIELAAAPLDLAYANGKVHVLLAANGAQPQGWLAVSPCDPPRPLPWPAGLAGAERLDVAADGVNPERGFVLVAAGTALAHVVCIQDPAIRFDVAYCTDFLVGAQDPEYGWLFVFARRPGEDFVRRRLLGRAIATLEGLQAPGYDGRGIAMAPDGKRIAYWSARGLRHAAPARTRYEEHGTVYGFALDSKHDQNPWGRIVLEACVPDGTRIELRCFTRDDLDYGDAIARTAPAGDALVAIEQPELTPLPSATAVAHEPENVQALYRDDSARPLAPPIDDGFRHYEAPVIAPPGRFLWIEFRLHGTQTKTPKLRAASVEYPQHDLLRQLPKTLWRDPNARTFLSRYLMPLAAMLGEWGEVAEGRHRLLDPRIAPSGALEWVASFMGLAMDPCWTERARRLMLLEVSKLFRVRGTPYALCRMIEILTGAQVLIIETFRLRGGGVIGNAKAMVSRSVLGVGFRVGGNIGRDADVALNVPADQAFDDYAHRFSVTVVARLSEEQLGCVRRLIETHKPAHTMFDLCTVDAGTRVGVGLHVGLASVVGKSSGFDPLVLGDSVLGKGYVLGRAELDRPAARAADGRMRDCREDRPA